MIELQRDLSVQELYENGELLIRVKSVCGTEGLEFLSQIVNYYAEHGTFRKLRKISAKSDLQLIDLAEKYKNCQFEYNQDKLKNSISKELEMLTVFQRLLLFKHCEFLISNLSQGALFILKPLDGSYFPEEIMLIIFSKEFSLIQHRPVFSKRVADLRQFKLSIIRLINKLPLLDDKQVRKEYKHLKMYIPLPKIKE